MLTRVFNRISNLILLNYLIDTFFTLLTRNFNKMNYCDVDNQNKENSLNVVPKKVKLSTDSLNLTAKSKNDVFNVLHSEKNRNLIKLSDEEKNMDGAPEGDLYQIDIIEESNLLKYENSQKLQKAVTTISKLSDSSNSSGDLTWFERCTLIEIFRRLNKFHSSDVHESVYLSIQSVIIAALCSLRSVEVRCAVLGLQSLLTNSYTLLTQKDITDNILALLNRSCTGPKFLCELSYAALVSICSSIPPELSINSLLESYDNLKNAQSATYALIIMSDCTQLLVGSNTAHLFLLPALIHLFSDKGMSSKKAEGRNASKNALLFIKSNLIRPVSPPKVQSGATAAIELNAAGLTENDSNSNSCLDSIVDNSCNNTDTKLTVEEMIEEEFNKLVENAVGKERAQYVFADLKKGLKRPLQPTTQPLTVYRNNTKSVTSAPTGKNTDTFIESKITINNVKDECVNSGSDNVVCSEKNKQEFVI